MRQQLRAILVIGWIAGRMLWIAPAVVTFAILPDVSWHEVEGGSRTSGFSSAGGFVFGLPFAVGPMGTI